ncbi:E3 ubiquitin-protein ligase TRIM39-like isoform X2 [Ambystoma mexicanum]|uniref:E3 ubiquitin-protein ligase TRIM39-like isoform X2 n=1 Tax=Ambystoma mexicanum TaxID=8296 RepID=UPI0037E96F23
MAAAAQLQSLKEEATCSICLEYFTDPVSVQCGHAFCRSCITRCWEGLETNFHCPQCRETSRRQTLLPNRQLGNVADIAKQLHNSCAATQDNMCREHEEKLKLFCGDDRRPICVVCRESRGHRTHKVRPVSEAAQEYKDVLYSHNKRLKKELKDLQEWIEDESRKASELTVNILDQRVKILSTFKHLKQFLEQEEQQLLSRLEEEHDGNMKTIQAKLTQLEKQQSAHMSLITELERKCQQQDVELLKDVKSVLGRCSEVKHWKPQEDAPGMETLLSIRRHAQMLAEIKGEVTLDSGTAHPWLIVSENGRSVRCGARVQDLPDTPQRFTHHQIVLGRQGLRSGRHYWEVGVWGSTGWALGVCDESVPRKEPPTLSPKGGIYTVHLWDGGYKAHSFTPKSLTPSTPPSVLGFFLDYEAGRFSVYDAEEQTLLFTFPRASFLRTVWPFFGTWSIEGQLQILQGAGGD